ncbi:MAG: hypothetical protein BZ136_09285 [Methanosphaera sp. rholeuAM74]|nr:MAG: hypothetical protein BZ136_09285 [Methanosphaera sp. rholeuAM74]
MTNFSNYSFHEELGSEHSYDEEIPWRPESQGETVTGVYQDKKLNVGQYQQTVFVLCEESGTLRSVWANKVLESKMAEAELGDIIRITYLGRAGKNGYHNYKVERGHPVGRAGI